MKTVSSAGWLAYGLALFVIVADQALKFWLVNVFGLEGRGVVPLLGPADLRLIWNQGISFGLLRDNSQWTRWMLAGFSLAVAVTLALWARRVERGITALAVGLVMGGAVGNLIDRARYGAVADFLDVTKLHFPWIFNIADSAISVGIAVLILESLFSRRDG